jgi:hypothetical protein
MTAGKGEGTFFTRSAVIDRRYKRTIILSSQACPVVVEGSVTISVFPNRPSK